jgi:hypothetical protein
VPLVDIVLVLLAVIVEGQSDVHDGAGVKHAETAESQVDTLLALLHNHQ